MVTYRPYVKGKSTAGYFLGPYGSKNYQFSGRHKDLFSQQRPGKYRNEWRKNF